LTPLSFTPQSQSRITTLGEEFSLKTMHLETTIAFKGSKQKQNSSP